MTDRIFSRLFCIVAVSLIVSKSIRPASGSDSDTLTGVWSCNFYLGSTPYPQDLSMTVAGGTVTGNEYYTGTTTSPFAEITGSAAVNSYQLEFVYNGGGYTVNVNGTISSNGLNGSWSSSANQSGSFECTRTSSVPIGGSASPTPAPDPSDAGKRKTATTVLCNRGPEPRDNFRCTATVGATDGGGGNGFPSGAVKFVTEKGSFPYGDTCYLNGNLTNGTTSSCSVVLAQPSEGIKAGTVIPVVASYQGDNGYAKSQSVPPKSTIAKVPKTPLVCLYESREYNKPCDGFNALGLAPTYGGQSYPGGTVSVSFYGANSATSSQASVRGRALSITTPKKKNQIAALIQYEVKISDNAAFKTLPDLKSFQSKLKSGFVISQAKTTLRYSETKTVQLKFASGATDLLEALRTSGVTSFEVQVIVKTLTKAQTKPSTKTLVVTASLE